MVSEKTNNKAFTVLEIMDTDSELKSMLQSCKDFVTQQKAKGILPANELDNFLNVADRLRYEFMLNTCYIENEVANESAPEAPAAKTEQTDNPKRKYTRRNKTAKCNAEDADADTPKTPTNRSYGLDRFIKHKNHRRNTKKRVYTKFPEKRERWGKTTDPTAKQNLLDHAVEVFTTNGYTTFRQFDLNHHNIVMALYHRDLRESFNEAIRTGVIPQILC